MENDVPVIALRYFFFIRISSFILSPCKVIENTFPAKLLSREHKALWLNLEKHKRQKAEMVSYFRTKLLIRISL